MRCEEVRARFAEHLTGSIDAGQDADLLQHIDAERASLQAELRSAVGLRGRRRPLGADSAERARKAVYARLREAT